MTKQQPNTCFFCEKAILAGEIGKQDTYVISGRYQKAWVHDLCAWMAGVRGLVNALWHNLQEQRRVKAQAGSR